MFVDLISKVPSLPKTQKARFWFSLVYNRPKNLVLINNANFTRHVVVKRVKIWPSGSTSGTITNKDYF